MAAAISAWVGVMPLAATYSRMKTTMRARVSTPLRYGTSREAGALGCIVFGLRGIKRAKATGNASAYIERLIRNDAG